MSTLDMPIGDTLALVNVVREAFGFDSLHDLPDARKGATQDCLYYRALKDVGATSVGGASIEFNTERQARLVAELWGTEMSGAKSVRSPRSVAHVINRFDNDGTPHYNV